MSMPIEHVSDTALWVASHRAVESERPDALFHDPLAAVLAGERGREIARSMPGSAIMVWGMALRTAAIDRFVLDAIQLGVDTVLNLGAGLDTRPYRMSLPSTLRWIEVDLPGMIEYKSARLQHERPVCRLERIALDLADREARWALFERVGREARCVLVITEGLLPYLDNAAVAELADDLLRVPSMRYWVQDVLANGLPRPWRRKLKAAPFRFRVDDWFAFFAEHGWTVKEHVTMNEQARRVKRPFPVAFPGTLLVWLRFIFMSPKRRARIQAKSGYAMFERADASTHP